MKLLVLLSSLFLTIFNKPVKPLVITEKVEVVESMDYFFTNYKVKTYNKITELYFHDKKIDVFNNPFSINYLEDEKNFYIFKKDHIEDYLNIYCYSDKGVLTQTKRIDNLIFGKTDVKMLGNDFIIIGAIKDATIEPFIKLKNENPNLLKEDCLLIRYNLKEGIKDIKLFGGKESESFQNMYIKDNFIYITGVKDQESGGDFGMGGDGLKGYFLAKFTHDFKLIDYLMFDKPIKNVDISSNLYIFTKDELFVFDYALNQKLGLKFESECIFGKTMFNYMIGILSRECLKIYDYKKNILLDSYNYKFSNSLEGVYLNKDYLYLDDGEKFYKGIFFDNILKDKTLIYDRLDLDRVPREIIGIPRNFKFNEIKYEENFNQGVFGTYDINLNYENILIPLTLDIKERCNVTSGYIYPVGYKLLFSGIGYLNGEEIFNNYEINEEGAYELKLVGKNSEVIKRFNVRKMDISYLEDQLKDWDYEIYKNQDLFIDYKIDNLTTETIKNVIVNGKSCKFKEDKDKKVLTLIINEENEGLYNYHIEKIEYEKDNEMYEEIINDVITVKVINDSIELENSFTNDSNYLNIDINIINNKKNIRYLALKSKGNKEEVTYIPLRNGKIIVNNENLNLEDVDFYLVYNSGRKYLDEACLFSFKYDFTSKELGTLEVIVENDEVKNIKFHLYTNKFLKSLSLDGEEIYQYSGKVNYLPVIITTVSCILFFVVVKIIKVKLRKKKNKELI